MLIQLFGKRTTPRRFVYTPRYYDPEKERERADRMDFRRSPYERRTSRLAKAPHPLVLLLLAVVVVALIFMLGPGREQEPALPDALLTPADVPAAEDAPAEMR